MQHKILFLIATLFYFCTHSLAMENSNTVPTDLETGKIALARTRQIAAGGAIIGGWLFFTATAARHAHWCYRAKRLPLAAFLFSSTIGNFSTMINIDNNPKQLKRLGNFFKSH